MASSNQGLDPRMQQFIQMETEKQKLQNVIHELNEKCWDTCTEGTKPGHKLDSRTEGCLRNCVERFLDANILITQRLEKKATELLNQHDSFSIE